MKTGFSRKEAREDGVSEAEFRGGRTGFSRKEAQKNAKKWRWIGILLFRLFAAENREITKYTKLHEIEEAD